MHIFYNYSFFHWHYHYFLTFIRDIYYKETEKTDNGLKHPASIYFPFHEKFGLLLLRFLNADLSNYETANKIFFYAYGFEILKDLNKDYKFELSNNYGSNDNYLKATNKIFEDLQENLIDLQQELIKAVTYIYNLDNNKSLEKYTYAERFAVYLIKRMGKLYSYYKNDYIMRDSYSRKYDEFSNNSEYEILESLNTKNMLISMSDTDKSNDYQVFVMLYLKNFQKHLITQLKNVKIVECTLYLLPK